MGLWEGELELEDLCGGKAGFAEEGEGGAAGFEELGAGLGGERGEVEDGAEDAEGVEACGVQIGDEGLVGRGIDGEHVDPPG